MYVAEAVTDFKDEEVLKDKEDEKNKEDEKDKEDEKYMYISRK